MSADYLFSVAFELPTLAILIVGLVLIGTRRAQIGPRSAVFGQIGLGLLILSQVVQTVWMLALPGVFRSLDASASQFGLVSSAVGVVLSVLFTGGVGLLIAAVVTRTHRPPAI